jgi:hypothetical protein
MAFVPEEDGENPNFGIDLQEDSEEEFLDLVLMQAAVYPQGNDDSSSDTDGDLEVDSDAETEAPSEGDSDTDFGSIRYGHSRNPCRGYTGRQSGNLGIELYTAVDGKSVCVTQEDIQQYVDLVQTGMFNNVDAPYPFLTYKELNTKPFILDYSKLVQVRHFRREEVWHSALYYRKKEVMILEWNIDNVRCKDWSLNLAYFCTQTIIIDYLRSLY